MRKKHKIIRLDQALRCTRLLRQQVRWLLRAFPKHLCLVQVGCYFEAFDAGARTLAKTLGLKLKPNWRGFPTRLLPKMLVELKKRRLPLVIVRQTGHELSHTKERLPELMVEYHNADKPQSKRLTQRKQSKQSKQRG